MVLECAVASGCQYITALTVRLPNSVHQKVKELALRDDISVNQFIAAAVSEKMASVMTLDYLKSEAPFWKKEQTADGARWVDARVSDEQALARWA